MKKKIGMTLLILFISLLIIQCASASARATILSSKKYHRVKPEDVVIYLSESDIDGKFEKIALINAKGSTTWADEKDIYDAARKEAGRIGANGLLLGNIKEPSTGERIAGTVFGVETPRRSQMVAVFVYKEKTK